MREELKIVGELSNDLFRIANMAHAGSSNGVDKFLVEAKKNAEILKDLDVDGYILNIAKDVGSKDAVDLRRAELYLMYGVLLQNWVVSKLRGGVV